MPIDYSKYPDNWKTEIRPAILERATDSDGVQRCEWCGAANYEPHPVTGSRVVLTIAHIYDHDPMNCDPGNLAALCQKCHNAHDAPMRVKNRKRKKRRKQEQAGQLKLW